MELIAGLDEVGMGSLAGPLLVVVTAFDITTPRIFGVMDSKQTTASQREEVLDSILKSVIWMNFGWATHRFIDKNGMAAAWQRAAFSALQGAPPFKKLMIDGNRDVAGYRGHQETIVKGDALHWQIGAASIIAKLMRDKEMIRYHNRWPCYYWNQNSGYGTARHYQAITEWGVSPIHRISFLKKWFKTHKPSEA